MSLRIVVQRILRWGIVLGVFAAAVAVPRAHEFRTVEVESLRVTIDSDWAARLGPGYLPVRFDVTNLGDNRVIEIVGQGSRSFRGMGRTATSGPRPGGTGTTEVVQVLRLRRGDRIRFTMSIPIFADSESVRFELRENGRALEHLYYFGVQSNVPVADASVLFVADPGSPFGSAAPKLLRAFGRGGAAGGGGAGTTVGSAFISRSGGLPRMPPVDYSLEPARLPVTWTGYTALRAVVIGKTEWDLLIDTQKSALVTWVACGGNLVLVDAQPADLLPSMSGVAATGPDRIVAEHFFGRVHALTTAALEAAGIQEVLKGVDASASPPWSLPANGAPDWGLIETRGFRLPIPGIAGVPARVYLAILVLFSLIIGPVSFWFLRRRKQRVLLVLTAPVISFAFIVLLTGYAIAGEGFSVHGRAATFTILDEAAKQAVTRASISMYAAGLSPSGGMRFGKDVAIFPIGPTGTGARDRLGLDLSEAQRFSSGVLQARAPTNFEEITVRAARERLTITRTGDGFSIVNGLDSTIKVLAYRDGDTMYRLESPLAAGAKGTLSKGDNDAKALVPGARSMGTKFEAVVSTQPVGTYLAVLDRSPFWEPGVANLNEAGSYHLVLGWPQGQSAGKR